MTVPEASFSAPTQTIQCHGMVSGAHSHLQLQRLIVIGSFSIWSMIMNMNPSHLAQLLSL
jgi:hypothetical protein